MSEADVWMDIPLEVWERAKSMHAARNLPVAIVAQRGGYMACFESDVEYRAAIVAIVEHPLQRLEREAA